MRRALITLVAAFVVIAACGLGVWFGYAFRDAQLTAKRMASDGRFAQLSLAINNYHMENGRFPPLTWVSEENGPQHSWRVALLPYLNGRSVLDSYNTNQPWNSKGNMELTRAFPGGVPAGYVSPLNCGTIEGVTNYVAVDATTKLWPSGLGYASRSHMIIGDDAFFILVEIPDSDVHWLEPRDFCQSQKIIR